MPDKEEGPKPAPAPTVDELVAERVAAVAQDMEIRLGQKIEALSRDIGKTLQPLVDGAVMANLPLIVDKLGEQFESKLAGRAESGGPVVAEKAPQRNGGGGGIGRILDGASVKDIIEVITAFKQPSSDQALAGVFNTFIRGMSFGQKMKTGGVTPQDLTDAIGFEEKKP